MKRIAFDIAYQDTGRPIYEDHQPQLEVISDYSRDGTSMTVLTYHADGYRFFLETNGGLHIFRNGMSYPVTESRVVELRESILNLGNQEILRFFEEHPPTIEA